MLIFIAVAMSAVYENADKKAKAEEDEKRYLTPFSMLAVAKNGTSKIVPDPGLCYSWSRHMKIIETIEGNVVKGRGAGKAMGFPTLNISYKGELDGVFTGCVYIDGVRYKAAINIGGSPTFDGAGGSKTKLCEAFLPEASDDFDFSGRIKVKITKKIRDTKKFKDKEDLKKQIAKDVDFVKMTPC